MVCEAGLKGKLGKTSWVWKEWPKVLNEGKTLKQGRSQRGGSGGERARAGTFGRFGHSTPQPSLRLLGNKKAPRSLQFLPGLEEKGGSGA